MKHPFRFASESVALQLKEDLQKPLEFVARSLRELELEVGAEKLTVDVPMLTDIVGASLFRLSNLIDLIRFSEDEFELSETRFSLRDLLEFVRVMILTASRSSDSEVLIHVDEDVPDELVGDPERLAQVIMNLLENVTLTDSHYAVVLFVSTGLSTADSVTLHFATSNTMASTANDEKLTFASLEDAQEFCLRNYQHAGIAIAVAYRLVEIMGGDLSVERVHNKGTSFRFSVQVQRVNWMSDLPVPMEISSPLARRRVLRVLVIDDNQINRVVLSKLMEKAGHLVDVVDSGAEALQLFSPGRYDLILSDLQMPLMSGFEVAREFRRLEIGTNHRALTIAVSALPYETCWPECVHSGFDNFVSKPIDSKQLLAHLEPYATTRVPRNYN